LGYRRPPKESPYYIEFEDGNHLYLNWVDEPTGRYFQVQTFISAMDFIDKHIDDGKNVFVHCDLGQSRSPTLAMTYLAKRTDYLPDSFDEAVQKFQAEYPPFNPSGIIKFVSLNWENIE
jgi:protein-tyrosine phosphatase